MGKEQSSGITRAELHGTPMEQNTGDCRFGTFSFQAGCLRHQGLHRLPLQPSPCSNGHQKTCRFTQALSTFTLKKPSPAAPAGRDCQGQQLTCCFSCQERLSPAADLSTRAGSIPHAEPQPARALLQECALKDAQCESLTGTLYLGKDKKRCKRDHVPMQTPTMTVSLTIAPWPPQHSQR